MKKSVKRILTIVLSIMIIMTYMIPGSVFADTAVDSDESLTAEVHEHDHAIEELSEGADDSDVVISDDEDPPVETKGEIIEEVPEAIEAEEPAEEVMEKPAEELPAAEETVTINDTAKAAAEEAPAVKAGTGGLSVLAFTSDTHNTSGNSAANRLGTWLDKMADIYGAVDVMAFGGDMAGAGASGYWDLTQADMNKVSERNITPVYTTGNHEISFGGDFSYSTYTSGGYSKTETKGQFEINKEVVNGSNYRVYALGSTSGSQSYANSISSLTSYLNSAGNTKPIFIITHFPLHWTSSRTTSSAGDVINVLNNAVENNGQKIVFLWGHNHTEAANGSVETHYDEIFAPGETIQYANGSRAELKFYYAAAGCMSDGDYGSGSGAVKGKGLVVTINSKNQLSFAYHNASGTNVTEDGTDGQGTAFTEQDPVYATSMSLSAQTATVEVGRTLKPKLEVSFLPEDTNFKSVTWSSSNPSAASVDSTGKVKGVSQGTTVITATYALEGSNLSASCTVTVVPRTTSDPEYVIIIRDGNTDYALNTEHSTDSYSSGNSYFGGSTYNGMVAVPYTAGSGADDEIRWTLEEADDGNGYYIKSSDDRYLNATYESSGSSMWGGSSTSNLKLDDTPDVWTFDGDIEDWLVDGSKLKSANTDRYLAEVTGSAGTHIITTRSSDSAATTIGELASDPVAVTGVSVTPATASVKERETVQLTATVTPADATNKKVTWSSSDTSKATVNENGVVTGKAEGSVTITATTVEGGFKASSTVTIIHNDNPSVEETINITPSTDNPEQSITINVGDTLVINTTNGSTNSGYNYTATLTNSGVAQIQGNSTINIASGGTGQFTVLGTADGTVDITIQNDQTSSQYVRKAVIHLTVGDGSSTPVDPPTGDTVSITPSTDNPEQSIKINVGDTLTINTTNGSSYSEYNYTITTADSSIAQIQGNATINIASGATGQFTVKGLAEGTVDIVIQNDQSSAQYVRKGTIHLTVEEGGTPVDPVAVTGVTVSLKTATVEARKTVQLTANVTPADATNKKVTWSSSDTSVATVDENGKVKGVAEGTAIITATTADGGKTDTCTVTVTQSTVTEKRYVIVIDGFALSTDRSPNEAQGGSSNYKYTGLAGVAYTAGEDPDDNISWIIDETEGGYYIKDLEGRYLNATYTSGNNSGQGNLKVDNTPDVWTIEGTLEEWMVDGKMLRSTNATNSTPDRPKFLGYEDSANLFTVRSEENADESTLIDPSVTIEERFVETSTLEDGKEYIIAVTKDSGSVYAIKNITGTDTGNTGSATLTVTPASGSDPAYIETDDADVVWKYQSSNQYMLASTGSNHYLGYESSTYKPRTSSSGRAITYSGGKLSIDTNHYLTCDNGTFGTSTSSSSGATVRLFVKTIEIITHEHVYGEPTWTWTGNVKTRAAVGATATFTCTECGEEIVKEAEVTSDIDSTGHTLYTATVTGPDGKEYTDQKYKAEDAQYTIKITANKENASVGDTVEFTITLLGPVDRFGSFQMTPVIPKGLTYKGFEIAEGLKDTLGFDNVDWEGTNLFFNGYGPYDYSSETDTVLATLSCTVNSEFSGSATLNINKDDFEVVSSKTWESMTEYYTIIPATIGAHTHTPGTAVRENEVQPTCTEAGGYDEVVYCTECGAEMSRTHVDVPALGHDWEFVDFTWTGSDEAGYTAAVANYKCRNDASHTNTVAATVISETTGATCEAAGKTVYTATVSAADSLDKKEHSATKEVAIPALGHDWEFVDFTWTEADNGYTAVANYKCKNDASHTNTVTAAVTSKITPATCEAAGKTVYTATVSAADSLDKKEHSATKEVAIPALGHDWEFVDITWTGSDEAGYTAAVANYKCKNDASHKNTVTATVTSEITPATCEAAGKTVYTATASAADSLDKKEHSATKEVAIPALGHDWEFVDITWTGSDEAGYTAAVANYKCKNDATHTNTVAATVTSETTGATCEAAGKTVYTATVAVADSLDKKEHSATKEVAIPALGHDWEFVDITWTGSDEAGYTAAVANYKCKNDASHKNTVTATVTSEITSATCEAAGKTVYTATVSAADSLDKQAHSDTKTVKIPATGHNYGQPAWTWAKDYSTASAKFTCANDATHIETVNATVAITQGTSEDIGKTVYTATAAFEGKSYTDIKKTVNQYTLTFFANEGDTEPFATITQDYGTAVNAPADPTKAFYTFSGWTSAVPATMPAENKTFTATWTAKDAYYLIGSMTEWKVVEANEFTSNPQNPAEYSVGATLAAGDEIKVVRAVAGEAVNTDYYPSNEHQGYNGWTDNYTVDQYHAGNVTVYFRPAGNFSDVLWQNFGGYFYIEGDHLITVNAIPSDKGTAYVTRDGSTAASATAPKGMPLTVRYTPIDNYQLDRIEILKDDGTAAEVTLDGASFNMPDYNVRVNVYFKVITWTFDKFEWSGSDEAGYTAAAKYNGDNGATKTVNATVTSETTAATCETAGKTVYTATVSAEASPDGKAQRDTKTVEIPALGHDWEFVDITWTEADNGYTAVANYKCKNDAAHTNTVTATVTSETTAATCETAGKTVYTATVSAADSLDKKQHSASKEVAIPALGHDWEFVDITWTETDNGYTAVANYKCKNDAAHTNKVAATVTSQTTAATCEEAGKTVYTATVSATASLDKQAHSDTKTVLIPALGHNWEFVDITWTGSDETGYTAAVANYKCKNDAAHTNTVAATVTSQTTAATCETAGKTVYTATVAAADSLDKKEHSAAKEVAIPALGHDWEFVDITWTEADNGYTAIANYKCKNDATHKNTVTATVASETTAATCETAGKIAYTATVSAEASLDKQAHSDTKTVAIPALGHDWEFVDITWTGSDETGYTAAVANYKCRNDAAHTSTVAATVTSETTAATCETAGKTVYTATVAAAASLDKKEHSMTKEVAIAALGHDWNTPLFVWSEDHTSVTAIFICKNNPAHIEKVTASGDAITSKVTTEPTEEKPGVMTYTASVTGPDGKIYTASDTEEIPALENKEVVRIYGQTRYETAIKVADELKAKLGVSEFSTIILAYGSNYADALAGSYLSCILDAPIILVDARQDHIDQAQAYIRKNLKNGGQIYILGGTGVVPESAVAGLSGYKIDRLGGATRYETNIEILKEAAKFSNDNSEILVCSGQNFPDSLSAAATGKPILLVKNALQDGQKTYLKSLGGSMTFTVIGGTGAVSDSVKNELNAYGKTDRVWGLTRYETSTAVAKKYFKNPEQGVIAYGVNFPDGLCGGVLAYNMDAPLLLAANGKTDAAVKYAGESGTTLGAVLGGPTLVSDASVRAILHMDKDSEIIVR